MFKNNSAPEASHINVTALLSLHHLGYIENQYRKKTQVYCEFHPATTTMTSTLRAS